MLRHTAFQLWPGFLLLLAGGLFVAQGQESPDEPLPEDDDAVIIVGAVISASISSDEVIFTDLGDGSRTVVQRPDGILVILARTEFSTTLPALTNSGIKALAEAQRVILARRLELALAQLIRELGREGTDLTDDDVAEVIKFLLSVDLPYDEGFFSMVVNDPRFGGMDQLFGDAFDSPSLFEPDPESPAPPPPPPPVVTPPIVTPPYFTP